MTEAMSLNGERTVDLLREKGINGLCLFDGCLCASFEVHRIAVDVSCRKSSGMDAIFTDFYGIGIRVYSSSMDITGPDLHAVAKEVARQLANEGYAIKVRFCDWQDDKDRRCTYCHKPRADLNGYLCDECLVRDDSMWGAVAEMHDHRKHEFSVTAAVL